MSTLTTIATFVMGVVAVVATFIAFAIKTSPDDVFNAACRWLKTAGVAEPKKRLHELWERRRLKAGLVVGVALCLLVAVFVGGMLAQAKLGGEPPVVATRPANAWEPLSEQETLALREELRKYEQEKLSVLCAIPACADLADSIFRITHSMGWPGNYESWYLTNNGIQDGIEIWSWPQKSEARDRIAGAIERATNGRLKISTHTWPTQPSQGSENDINLVIGRFR